jgi:hypothetical protein
MKWDQFAVGENQPNKLRITVDWRSNKPHTLRWTIARPVA